MLATATDRFALDPDKLVFYARDEVCALQSPAAGPLPPHILLIIDESVSGLDLSINGYAKDTTPWLQSVLGERDDIVNFGVANSVSNASAWSNLILRIGLTPEDVDDFDERLAHLPTFFQYARAAGFRTMLIDAQAEEGQLQNHLTLFDKKSIDAVVYKNPKDLPYERDIHLLDNYLETIRQTQDRTFTVFVRTGAQWPWADKYPADAEIFKPAQNSTFGSMTEDNEQEVTNTYLNTLRFNVDGFFELMIDKLHAQEIWTAYTSDHGVSIFEDGTPRTHGSFENVPHGQLAVPLMIFGEGAMQEFPVSAGERYSQFQIFPTLLKKMGYPNTVVDRYGPSLHEPWPKNRTRTTYVVGRGELIPFEDLN